MIIQARRAAARQAAVADGNAESDARRLAREERAHSISTRKNLEAWSAEGKRYFGTPVEGDEWMALNHGAYCILTEGDVPKTAFIVKKKGSKVSKVNETEVFPSPPSASVAQAETPEAVKMVTIKKDGDSRQVPVFRDFQAVRALRAQGLNSGTWVAVQPVEGQNLNVYAVYRKTIDTIGEFQSASLPAS
jgi:hypothetical protein